MIEIPWGKFPLVDEHEHAHQWLQFYANIGRAPNTIVTYGCAVDDHLRLLADAGIDRLRAGIDVIAAWIGDMLSRPPRSKSAASPSRPRRCTTSTTSSAATSASATPSSSAGQATSSPRVTGAKLDERPADAQPFTAPEQCPHRGGDIDSSQKRWRCTRGRACGAAESLRYFAARDSMDIEGLGDKIVDGLVNGGLVTDPADLYDPNVSALALLDWLGRTSAIKLVAAIQASKTQPLPGS